MASKPSDERRSLYPWARKENELSRSKIRKGILARRRDCASKREARPAPEMRIGFWVLTAIMLTDNIEQLLSACNKFRLDAKRFINKMILI
jgi:hypothetical protein